MRNRYPIEIAKHRKETIYYPTDFGENDEIHTIAFGSCSIPVNCSIHPEGKNCLVLSEDISKQLSIPNVNNRNPLHLFLHNGTINIGPLVGIITSGFTPIQMRPVGERSYFFEKLLSVQKSVGALSFIFGEQHIDWEHGLISGYFYDEGQWEVRKVPFPHVIYDRLPNRRAEKRLSFTKVKKKLQNEYFIPWFNPGFFNKLDVNERLLKVPEVKQYLPETYQFTTVSIIERMLADYRHVYLKPMNGSLGLGIHQIIYDKKNNVYYCRYHDHEKANRLQKFNSLETLMSHIFANKYLENMLVQQGIHLLRINDRKVDFRVHTNKDETGEWRVSAIAAKVADIRSATTHLKNGGSVQTLAQVFPQTDKQKIYKEKLSAAALALSSALENQTPGIIGEIGFDLGIDTKGNIWLFEANSKPGRSIFLHPNLTDVDLLTRKLTLAFSIFLSEKVISHPEEVFN